MSTRMRLSIALLLTVACLAAALIGIQPRAIGEALLTASPIWLLPALLGLIGTFSLRVLRYRLLLGPVPFRIVLSACAVGFFAIQTLPLRLGEFVRPYMLAEHDIPWGRSLGAVAVERLFDLLVLLGMITAVGQVDLPADIVLGGVDVLPVAQSAAGASAALLGMILLAALVLGEALASRLPGPLASVTRSAIAATRALDAPTVVTALFGSMGIWACNIATVWALLYAVPGLPTQLDVALTVCTATVAGVLAVPTPGMMGAFEASVRAALAPWSAPGAGAAALAILWHGLTFGFHMVVGLAALLHHGVSLRELVEASRRER